VYFRSVIWRPRVEIVLDRRSTELRSLYKEPRCREIKKRDSERINIITCNYCRSDVIIACGHFYFAVSKRKV